MRLWCVLYRGSTYVKNGGIPSLGLPRQPPVHGWPVEGTVKVISSVPRLFALEK